MEISPEKCGIKISPSSFVIFYRKGDNTLRMKKMPLRNFKSSSNVQFVARNLKERHSLEGIPLVKIEKLLRLLQELLNGVDKSDAIKKIDKEFEIKVNEDLNKLSVHELDRQKELMDSLFLKNQIKKDDENFIYDKQMDFTGEKEESNWDLDDNFWD